MSTETLTAEQALDEVLTKMCRFFPGGWRALLKSLNDRKEEDQYPLYHGTFAPNAGNLRRWAAPLLATEG